MKISIIIPVLNEESHLQQLLPALACVRQQGHEIIVVDGGNSDASTEIAGAYSDHCISSLPGRARQMNAGATVAKGDILLFLHADCRLPRTAMTDIRNAIQAGAMWGRFDVHIDNTSILTTLIAWMMNMRSRLSNIATGDQCLFVRRSVFENIGGYADIALMEDIDISARLRSISRPACLYSQVRTSPRRWRTNGVFKTMLLMWRLRFLYWAGISADTLADLYYPTRQKNNEYAVFVFAKPPLDGQVKTRLARLLSATERNTLHRKLCMNTLEMARATGLKVELWTTDSQNPYMQELAHRNNVVLKSQSGNNLGERMQHAVSEGLRHYKGIVIIGTDCPVMCKEYIQAAIAGLEKQCNDTVIGPAEDGGYVLLGVRRLLKSLFENISWGTDEVYAQTLQRLGDARASYTTLEPLWDVDRPEDYHRYRKDVLRLTDQAAAASG